MYILNLMMNFKLEDGLCLFYICLYIYVLPEKKVIVDSIQKYCVYCVFEGLWPKNMTFHIILL